MDLRERHPIPGEDSSELRLSREPTQSQGSSKPHGVFKRKLHKELWELQNYAQRVISCRASKLDYAILPVLLLMFWTLVYLIMDSHRGIRIEERLGESYLKKYYEDQVKQEHLMRLSEERDIRMRPGEVLDIIYALPYLDTNPLLGVEHLKTLEAIMEHSTVPLNFHLLTNRNSEDIVKEILSRISKKFPSTELKYSTYPLEDFEHNSQSSICPKLSNSKEFCSLLISQLPPFLFPFAFESLEKAIYLDHRLTFTDDIGLLIHAFRRLESGSEAIGVVHEQSSRYMRSFGTWQRINPSTKIGRPPGESRGKPGFNPSLMVLNLSKLRNSAPYRAFLNEKRMTKLINTFKYHATRDTAQGIDIGDALNLLAVDVETLFHTLDCTWNRRSDDSLDPSDKKFNVCNAKTGTRAWNGEPSQEKIQRDQLDSGESIYIVKNNKLSLEDI